MIAEIDGIEYIAVFVDETRTRVRLYNGNPEDEHLDYFGECEVQGDSILFEPPQMVENPDKIQIGRLKHEPLLFSLK